MPENDPGSITRRRRSDYTPDHAAASIGRRVKSAERHIARWRSTFPEIPRPERKRLAAMLVEDDQPGGAE